MQGIEASRPHPRGGMYLHSHRQPHRFLTCLRFLPVLGLVWLLAGCAFQDYPIEIVFDHAGGWRASFALPGRIESLAAGEAQLGGLTALAGALETEDIDLGWEVIGKTPDGPLYAVELEGSEGPEQLRGLLFGGLSAYLNPLGESTLLNLEGSVRRGETLEFVLESIPGTGYLWQPVQFGGAPLQPVGATRFEPRSGEIGAPERQVMTYQALEDGPARVSWVYRRPWEEPAGTVRAMSIRAPDLAQIADLSNPRLALPVFGLPERQDVSIAAAGEVDPSLLPASFDWRRQGKVTAVRDQGACGSCWAFGAVSVLETAIQIQDGQTVDLSEQYLVSCNQESWGCAGGWTAHSYHLDRMPPTESLAGAVLESDFPYAGRDLPCSGPYTHPYQIQSWSSIGSWDNPDVEAIKQAIYTYGSVQSAVCVGPRFMMYRNGVFSTDESRDCWPVNHAVTLVGWDDTLGEHGVWILRNSWGTNWGDRGYMLIDREVSRIGYAANYIDYKGTVQVKDGGNQAYLPLVAH